MGNKKVPDDGLETFSYRCDMRLVDGRYDDHSVADFFRIAAVFPDDTDDFRSHFLRVPDGPDQVGADILFFIPATDGKDKETIART